jgi:hypothetical protein
MLSGSSHLNLRFRFRLYSSKLEGDELRGAARIHDEFR